MSTLHVPPPYIISTAEQSKRIDAHTIKKFGIDGYTLMEVAGSSAAKHLLEKYSGTHSGVILCGKGNNAGDALVVARYLLQYGIDLSIVFLSGTGDLSKDTQTNYTLLNKIVEHDTDAGNLRLIDSWQQFDPPDKADFILDGMLGTGLDSDLRGDYNVAVEWANQSDSPVYAIDIPTGLHADTGRIMGSAVKADTTFACGTLKQGFYLNEGFDCRGSVVFCELPFPNYLKKECSSYLIDDAWIREQPRTPAKHKYDGGVLYIIAGSEGLTGAAILSAKSAWAEGLGAVIMVCPHGNLEIYEKNLPQIIKKDVGARDDLHFKSEHASKVLDIINEKKGTVLLGPGLGREQDTADFVETILENYHGNILIDADALWALSQWDNWSKPSDSRWILTPHPGELSKLFGSELKEDPQRLVTVKKKASEKQLTMVSKGFPVIVGTKEGEGYLTAYDSRAFSRAGFGDVLAGKIGAYWSLGYGPVESSALGLLNGKHKLDNLMENLDNNEKYIPEPNDLI